MHTHAHTCTHTCTYAHTPTHTHPLLPPLPFLQPGPWIFVSESQTDWLGGFFALSEAFAVPIFFTLSGYFTEHSLQRTRLWPFWKHRLKRLMLPLVTMLHVVNPASYYWAYKVHSQAPDAPTVGIVEFYMGHWLGLLRPPQFLWHNNSLSFPLSSKIHMWYVETLLGLTALWSFVLRPIVLAAEPHILAAYTSWRKQRSNQLTTTTTSAAAAAAAAAAAKEDGVVTLVPRSDRSSAPQRRGGSKTQHSAQWNAPQDKHTAAAAAAAAAQRQEKAETRAMTATDRGQVLSAQQVLWIGVAGGVAVGCISWLVRIWHPLDERFDLAFTYVKPARYPQYLFNFGLGAVLARAKSTLKIDERAERACVAVSCAWMLVFLVARAHIEGDHALIAAFKGGRTLQSLGLCLCESLVCGLATFGLISGSMRHASYHSRLSRRLSSATFGVYMLHIPVVMFWQTLLQPWDVQGSIKWVAVTLLSLPSSFVLSLASRAVPVVNTCLGL